MKNVAIAAVDFDGTIVKDKYPELGEINESTVRYVKFLKETGYKLILWTCRHGKMLEDAVQFCSEIGINFDAVNANLPEIIDKYGNDSRKIYADIYIDDRAFVPKEVYYNHLGKQ